MKEALKLALETLKEAHDLSLDGRDFAARQIILDVIANLEKEALAQPEFAIGDIRALRHRIHELEGEVIGYKQILDAQPEQEPVDFDAIIADIKAISCRYRGDPSHDHCPYKIRSESADTVRRHASYYTTPPQRKPLTDEKIAEVAERMEATDAASSFWREFARAIEAAYEIKE